MYVFMYVCVCVYAHTHTHTHTHMSLLIAIIFLLSTKCFHVGILAVYTVMLADREEPHKSR